MENCLFKLINKKSTMLNLPKFHLFGSTKLSLSSFLLFTTSQRSVIYLDLPLTFCVSFETLDYVVNSFISIIEFSGLEPAVKRQLGSNWRSIINDSIYVEYASVVKYIHTVQNNPTVYFDTIKTHFKNVNLTQGSIFALKIVTANSSGFSIPGTGIHFNLKFSIRDFSHNDYLNHAFGGNIPEDVLNSETLLVPRYFGYLKVLSDVIPSFNLYPVNIDAFRNEQVCLGDIITFVDNQFKPESRFMLRADGVSALSMAFNVVYGTSCKFPDIQNVSLLNILYIPLGLEITNEISNLITDVWLNISFSNPTFVNENGDDQTGFGGTDPEDDPSGSSDVPENVQEDRSSFKPVPDPGKGSSSKSLELQRPNNPPSASFALSDLSENIDTAVKMADTIINLVDKVNPSSKMVRPLLEYGLPLANTLISFAYQGKQFYNNSTDTKYLDTGYGPYMGSTPSGFYVPQFDGRKSNKYKQNKNNSKGKKLN